MRRTAVVMALLSTASTACHRSQAAPAKPADPSPDASITSADVSIDSGDPSIISQSNETTRQIEPHLAAGGDALTVAWMGVRSSAPTTIGVRTSHDAGEKWGPMQTLTAPDGRWASDPIVGIDGKGTTYVAYLGFRPNPSGAAPADAHVYVTKGADDASLGAPVDLLDPSRRMIADKPWLVVSPAGTAVAVWSYSSPTGNGIGTAAINAKGAWTPTIAVERQGLQASLPYVCSSTTGARVWLTYLDAEVGVRIRASDDGGVSWSPARTATVSPPEDKARMAAEAPACVGEGNDVVVVYGRTRAAHDDARSAPLDSIVVARSFDSGRSFDWKRVIEAGEGGALHPQVAREPDGAIDVAFYAAGSGAADAGDVASLRWVRIDKETAAVGPQRVARPHLRVMRERSDPSWPGDYFGFAWHDGKLLFAAIDATGDEPHVAFTAVTAK